MSAKSGNAGVFTYRPLTSRDSIRILFVQPSGDSTAAIRCNLIHTTLSERQADLIEHYIALSYAWGSSENKQTILVDNCIKEITINLRNALRDIREERRTVRIWADALCINQDDDEEKNQQVGIMGQIYSTAHHTIIYLGEPTDQIWPIFHDQDGVSWIGPVGHDQERKRISQSQFHLAARALLEREWFSRIWILQELAISRDSWIQCGRFRLPWQRFYQLFEKNQPFVKALDNHEVPPELRSQGYNKLQSLNDIRIKYQADSIQGHSHQNLLDLVVLRRGLGCTDPRDRIFGHLGLAGLPRISDDASAPLTNVDYGKSPGDVFADFAEDVIRCSASLNIFCYKEDLSPSQRMKSLPSWAPDWTVDSQQKSQPLYYGLPIIPLERKSDHDSYKWIPETRLLAITATSIPSTISYVSQIIPWNATEIIPLKRHTAMFAEDMKSFLDGHSAKIYHHQHYIGVYQATLKLYSLVPGLYPRIWPPMWQARQDPFPQLLDCLARQRDGDPIWSGTLADHLFHHTFQKKTTSVLAGRRIAALEDGRRAAVPSATRAKDLVILLKNIPFVFRPINVDLWPIDKNRITSQLHFDQMLVSLQNCILIGPGFIFQDGYSHRGYSDRNLEEGKKSLLVIH